MATGSDASRLSTVNRRYRYDLQILYHCQNLSTTFLYSIENKNLQHLSADTTNFDLKGAFQESVCVLCFLCQHNLESIQHHVERLDKTLSRRLVLCSTDSGIPERNVNVELVGTNNGALDGGLLRKIHSVLEGSKLYDDSGSTTAAKRTLSHTISEPLPTYALQCEPPSSPRSDVNDHLYEPLLQNGFSSQPSISTGRYVEATSLQPNEDGIQILDSLCLPKGNYTVSYLISSNC